MPVALQWQWWSLSSARVHAAHPPATLQIGLRFFEMDGAQLFGAIGSSFMMATILVVRARTALATATATMTTV